MSNTPRTQSLPLLLKDWGVHDYESVWQAMHEFTANRDSATEDQVWVVEHPPVFTLGQAGLPEHLLNPENIPVVKCDRGGQVTYHGPGQLVVYPLLNLHRLKLGVRDLVQLIEAIIIETLNEFDIDGERKQGAPGVYVEGKKIGALGLRVKRGYCFHGLSLNVDMDLTPFQRINPCGYPGLEVTQIKDYVKTPINVSSVSTILLKHLTRQLNFELKNA